MTGGTVPTTARPTITFPAQNKEVSVNSRRGRSKNALKAGPFLNEEASLIALLDVRASSEMLLFEVEIYMIAGGTSRGGCFFE